MGDKSKTEKRTENLKPFKEGESGNPNGRPKGQKNYATLYREALIAIAKANTKTPEEIEQMLHETGLKKAIKGDFAFYRDVLDRLYGKPQQKVDHTTAGKPLILPSEIINKNEIK